MKYKSNNVFADFEFHDSYFKLENIKDNVLTISVEHLNIHKSTEFNPHNTDMEIELAKITFNNLQVKSFKLDKPQVIFDGKIAEQKSINELTSGATIYEFGTLENGNHYFDGTGVESWFQVQFLFDSATIEWDTFKKPAWYEEKTI